jgi:hypothetical protein
MFPRFLLPAVATVGTVNQTALAAFRAQVASTMSPSPSSIVNEDMRLDDYTWLTILTNQSRAAAAGVSLLTPNASGYSVFPVLVDCQGRQVTTILHGGSVDASFSILSPCCCLGPPFNRLRLPSSLRPVQTSTAVLLHVFRYPPLLVLMGPVLLALSSHSSWRQMQRLPPLQFNPVYHSTAACSCGEYRRAAIASDLSMRRRCSQCSGECNCCDRIC